VEEEFELRLSGAKNISSLGTKGRVILKTNLLISIHVCIMTGTGFAINKTRLQKTKYFRGIVYVYIYI
jgi:hypothetical protein